MYKTEHSDTDNPIMLDYKGIAAKLNCGRRTVEKIAAESQAVVRIGKRKLYNVKKIERYLDSISQ